MKMTWSLDFLFLSKCFSKCFWLRYSYWEVDIMTWLCMLRYKANLCNFPHATLWVWCEYKNLYWVRMTIYIELEWPWFNWNEWRKRFKHIKIICFDLFKSCIINYLIWLLRLIYLIFFLKYMIFSQVTIK